MKTINKLKIALVDSGACYNVINSKLYNTLKDVNLIPDNNVPALGITEHTKFFVGKVFLKLKIKQLICLDEFYVLPPHGMILPTMILGTPWQRKYKAVPD